MDYVSKPCKAAAHYLERYDISLWDSPTLHPHIGYRTSPPAVLQVERLREPLISEEIYRIHASEETIRPPKVPLMLIIEHPESEQRARPC